MPGGIKGFLKGERMSLNKIRKFILCLAVLVFMIAAIWQVLDGHFLGIPLPSAVVGFIMVMLVAILFALVLACLFSVVIWPFIRKKQDAPKSFLSFL